MWMRYIGFHLNLKIILTTVKKKLHRWMPHGTNKCWRAGWKREFELHSERSLSPSQTILPFSPSSMRKSDCQSLSVRGTHCYMHPHLKKNRKLDFMNFWGIAKIMNSVCLCDKNSAINGEACGSGRLWRIKASDWSRWEILTESFDYFKVSKRHYASFSNTIINCN